MIIFFLDDQEVRHELAEKVLGKDHTILHAYDIVEGISVIKACQEKIGLGLLDHDLGCVDYYGNGEVPITGEMFLNGMFREVPENQWFAQVIIHSYNATGAKVMKDILLKNDIISTHHPFSEDMLKQLVSQLRAN